MKMYVAACNRICDCWAVENNGPASQLASSHTCEVLDCDTVDLKEHETVTDREHKFFRLDIIQNSPNPKKKDNNSTSELKSQMGRATKSCQLVCHYHGGILMSLATRESVPDSCHHLWSFALSIRTIPACEHTMWHMLAVIKYALWRDRSTPLQRMLR